MTNAEQLTDTELLAKVDRAWDTGMRTMSKFYCMSYLTRKGSDPETLKPLGADLLHDMVVIARGR